MQAYQERVVKEKQELDERREKLSNFTLSDKFQQVPEAERGRMIRQLDAMGYYSEILGERIAAFIP